MQRMLMFYLFYIYYAFDVNVLVDAFPSSARSLPRRGPRLGAGPSLKVGILGAGQLGRMLALAAARLGLRAQFFSPSDSGACAGLGHRVVGAWNDRRLLGPFLFDSDVVTLENECLDLATVVDLLPEHARLWPSKRTVDWISDRLVQKRHALSAGFPVGAFRGCRTVEQALLAAKDFSFPVVLKGRGDGDASYRTTWARDESQLRAAYGRLAQRGTVLLEAAVPFTRELSVIVVRRADGVDDVYPVAHTRRTDHRCDVVEVPAPCTSAVAVRAQTLARAVAAAFGCVGVVAVEMFELASGELLVNELSARPHNTGHFTIDACVTSQFENHLRAILGWSLGDTSLLRPAGVTVNVFGTREGRADKRGAEEALNVSGAVVHMYGHESVRPGKRMGHVTVVGDDLDDVRWRAREAAGRIRP